MRISDWSSDVCSSDLKPMNPEARLLKFCGPTSYALQNLENGQIFCQHYAAYNDPFEFWTTISTGIPDPDSEPERYLAALRAWGFDCRTVEEEIGRASCRERVCQYV